MKRLSILVKAVSIAAGVALGCASANADPIPDGWQASGLKPIGYTDLGGRRGLGIKLAIKRVGDRWSIHTR